MMVLDRGKDCAMEQKQAIEQRISRRSFLQTPIEQQILRQLLEAIEEVNETSGLTVSYLEDGSDAFAGFKSYGMFDGVRAMLVLKGNRELAFLKEKVGYYGEQLILKATELGLGSCWVGGTFDRRSAVFEPSPEEEMVCVVPIGKVAQSSRKERMIRGVIHRKSKTIEEMVRADRPLTEEERQAMQLVQLAPTAKNTQKPVFIFAGDKIYAGVADDEPFDLVDLGICKLHFEIGMKQLFLQGHFEFGNGSIYKRS
ncbi:MAG: nitroreductase family protein [Negativibacillus sp.]|jgi:hypothetical protein|nr:nitroreductase family protein [Negativibacillus sp.]